MKVNLEYENFLKERNTKEEYFYRIYSQYRPNYNKSPVANKFYSKNEVIHYEEADPDLVTNIRNARNNKRDKSSSPATENQVYGWLSQPLVPIDRRDDKYYFPYKHAPFIRQEIRIKTDAKARKCK